MKIDKILNEQFSTPENIVLILKLVYSKYYQTVNSYMLIVVSRLMIKILRSSNIIGRFFAVIALILPIIGFLAPNGITLLAIFASLEGFVIFKIQNRNINFLERPFIILFFLIALWALIS